MSNDELKDLLGHVAASAKQVNILTGEHAQAVYNEAGAEQKHELEARHLETVEKLKPIFFGIESEAKEFVISIQGMKPVQITEHVNRLVTEGKISGLSRKRDLYSILHEAKLYTPTEQNWNMQVK